MDEERVRAIIREELPALLKSFFDEVYDSSRKRQYDRGSDGLPAEPPEREVRRTLELIANDQILDHERDWT
jgi:hypothetical protein